MTGYRTIFLLVNVKFRCSQLFGPSVYRLEHHHDLLTEVHGIRDGGVVFQVRRADYIEQYFYVLFSRL